MMPQSMEEWRGKPLDDLGFRGQVAFDNFREILSGILPPPRNLQDFKDQFLRGMLDSVCRTAKSYVSDVQNYIDVSPSLAPVL
ncbi:hypothetical protein V1264_010767 [Littorina saxatilis]|uniref:Uncharacterized protein n=1 Tax=Littorina saxatilis TaxID=31220 RepID=A0AAN9G0U9_9CAEN